MLRVRPWAGGSHEGRYVQVLDYNQVVIPHQGRGYLFNPVMAPTHWPDMGTGQLGLSPGSLVRFLLLPGQLLLETYYTPLFPDVQLGCAEHLVVRGGQGGADPPVDPDGLTGGFAQDRELGGPKNSRATNRQSPG